MVAFKLLLAATASGLVAAWPEPTAAANLDNRAIDCSKVTGALSVLKKLGPPATTFCSSYLKIPCTKTSTTTITPPAITSTTSTSTVIVTSAVCPQQKRNAPIDYQGFEKGRAADIEDIDKRGNILGLLAAFATAKVSEGCSCLNLKPKATKTATSTVAAPTVNVVATSTECVVAQPSCKPNGFGNTCTQTSQCCSGACGSTFDSTICCNPNGQYCDLNRPDGCCSGTCLNTGDLSDLDGTCI